MALRPGTRIGPYEVAAQIGVGGMGEVYKARDTRLDRTVAIKILPATVTDDADARARFEREARAIAALDHPHICAIYDVGQHDGVHYLVMPHLDGETLAARLGRTKAPLPLDQVLAIAIALADALDRTHRAGITHRDLKPGNIMLTKAGAKLLDFGLAKLQGPTAPISMSGMTRLATATPKTAHGMILGTVQYMAPEQVEGRPADARSDMWAFGAVLYEMATGQRPFEGESPASVIGAILKDHPPALSTRQPLAPRALDQLVDRCFAKDPEERWQSMGDVKHQLMAIASMSTEAAPGAALTRRGRHVPLGVVAAGVVALLAVIGGLVIWSGAMRPAQSTARPLVRLAIDPGRDASFSTDFPVATLSPDGTRMVFASTGADGTGRLSTRLLDQPEATPLPGTEGAYSPFYSPDGQWVGFFAGGKLKKTRLDGSAPVVLCDAPSPRGASWGDDGRIAAALDSRQGLSLVAATGGAVTRVTDIAPGELSHRWPQMLPGGKAAVFIVSSVPGNYGAASIAAVSLENNPQRAKKILIENAGMAPHYLPTGHLVYFSNGALQAVPFDVEHLAVRGSATAVLEDVSASIAFGSAQLDVSRNGTALYRSGQTSGKTVIHWLNRDGTSAPAWAEPAVYQFPRVSPDGSRLAVVSSEGSNADIWVYDWQRGTKTRLSTGTGVNSYPIWSPNGEHVVFSSAGQVYSVRADGAERPRVLIKTATFGFPASFTADGQRLLFYELNAGGGSRIQSVRVDSEAGQLRAGTPELFRDLTSANPHPAISPDGHWVAYASSESGVYEVYVRAFPDHGRQWPISSGGGSFPEWSRTANELFYRTEDQRIMVASFNIVGDTFVAAKPRVWSDKRLFNSGYVQNFDLAPDGKRFAVLLSADGEAQRERPRLMLALNFFDEVRRRVAAGRE